jgi:capsular polysaccharide biosynthesis protein
MFKPNSFLLSFYKKILFNKVRKVQGNCVVVHHSYYQNYYHFLLEILPRLFLVKDQAATLKLIINKNIPSFIREYIELIKFKEIIFIEDTEVIFVEKLDFPSYSSRGLAYNETIIKEMAEWLQSKLFLKESNNYKKIFISRNNAKYRNTVNETELFNILEKRGFVKFNLDNPSIIEQANFFKNAEYIIGSHGAGFSNMIYSPKCKLVIDIIHENHPQDCFYNLANVFDIDYYYFQCKGIGKDSYANNDDIIVDLTKFEKVINQYIPE